MGAGRACPLSVVRKRARPRGASLPWHRGAPLWVRLPGWSRFFASTKMHFVYNASPAGPLACGCHKSGQVGNEAAIVDFQQCRGQGSPFSCPLETHRAAPLLSGFPPVPARMTPTRFPASGARRKRGRSGIRSLSRFAAGAFRILKGTQIQGPADVISSSSPQVAPP